MSNTAFGSFYFQESVYSNEIFSYFKMQYFRNQVYTWWLHCLVCTSYKSTNMLLEKKEQNAASLWASSHEPRLKRRENMLHIKNNRACCFFILALCELSITVHGWNTR